MVRRWRIRGHSRGDPQGRDGGTRESCLLTFTHSASHGDVMRSIHALLGSAARGLVGGLAVVAVVVVWFFTHMGTYALSVVGVSGALLPTTATPADAQWRRWRRPWRRWRRWRRWR